MNILAKGIDVSTFQGDIDWNLVKENGVEFAILRSSYGSSDPSQIDDKFYQNVKGCQDNNIPMGAYHYGYAMSVGEARNEAQFFLDTIKGINFDYSLWYDVEDSRTMGKLSKQELTDVINAFCEVIANAGYTIGVYANTNWLNNKMCVAQINYPIWAAQYNGTDIINYDGSFDIWQYASDGNVNGISGRVDMNYCYVTYDNTQPSNSNKNNNDNAPSRTYAHSVGEHVVFSSCYTSSIAPISEAIYADKMVKNDGVITTIVDANNPYLIDNGVCWVNDGDIRGLYGEDSTPVPTQAQEAYTVVSGDTLSDIAEKYNMSLNEIVALNPQIEDVNCISIGEQINISGYSSVQQSVVPQEITYIVQVGDTLSSIASQYGTDYQTIADTNGIDNPNVISVGQVLTIPQ